MLSAMLLTAALSPWTAMAQDQGAAKVPAPTSEAKEIGQQVRKALEAGVADGKMVTVSAGDKPASVRNPKASRQYIRVWANATTGPFGNEEAPTTMADDALRRWERREGGDPSFR